MGRSGRTVGVALVAVALGLGAFGLARAGADAVAAVRAPGPVPLDEAVVAVAAWAACLIATWLAVGVLVSLVGLLARRPATRVLPVALHHVVAVALGATLVAGAGAAATSASAPDRPPVVAAVPHVVGEPDPGWSPLPEPGWTPSAPAPAPLTAAPADPVLVAAPRPATGGDPQVVVRRGDTLWDIAARHLPAGSSDAEIAAAWPRWYEANAAVIGDDPDLLVPGQLLVSPGSPP